MTPRKLLQLLGTEAGRNIIHPNIWVNALFADYVCDDCGQKECPTDEEDTGQMIHRSFPRWIITDVRFPNEVKAVKERGGIMIRVNRGGFSITDGKETINNVIETDDLRGHDDFVYTDDASIIYRAPDWKRVTEHPSETALDDYDGFDYVVENDGSIEDLVDKIRQLNIV